MGFFFAIFRIQKQKKIKRAWKRPAPGFLQKSSIR